MYDDYVYMGQPDHSANIKFPYGRDGLRRLPLKGNSLMNQKGGMMPSYGPHYGPFASRTAAQIGLCRLADRKFGPNIGVAWQDGQFAQLFRPPVKTPDGLTKMLVVEHLGPTPTRLASKKQEGSGEDKIPTKAGIAWDTVNTVVDVAAVAIATVTFVGAITALFTAGAAVGATCLVVFSAVELLDSFALLIADGRMTIAEYQDRRAGSTTQEEALKQSGLFNFVETWGPIIALPAIGKDITDFMKFRQIGCELEELTHEMNRRLGALARDMVMTGDDFILERMKILRQQVRDVEEGIETAADKMRDFFYKAGPADLWAALNDGKNIQDIKEGLETDFRSWMNDVNGCVHGWEARARAHLNYSSPIARAAANQGTTAQMVYKSTNHVRLHLVTAKPQGKAK